MDILDRLLGHDMWTTRQLLLLCRQLPDEQLDQRFEFGQETLRKTLDHLIGNMEIWTDLMHAHSVPATGLRERHSDSVEGLIARFEAVAIEFVGLATKLRNQDRPDETFVDVLDAPARKKTFGGAIVHLATHSMHHRAQILAMLDMMGVAHNIEGDALGWERQLRGGWEIA